MNPHDELDEYMMLLAIGAIEKMSELNQLTHRNAHVRANDPKLKQECMEVIETLRKINLRTEAEDS